MQCKWVLTEEDYLQGLLLVSKQLYIQEETALRTGAVLLFIQQSLYIVQQSGQIRLIHF